MNSTTPPHQLHGDIENVASRLEMLDSIVSFLFEDIEVNIDGSTVTRKRDILSVGEKICLNQERASLREYRDHLLGKMNLEYVRFYKVSTAIEKKFFDCVITMEAMNWTKKINEIEVKQ